MEPVWYCSTGTPGAQAVVRARGAPVQRSLTCDILACGRHGGAIHAGQREASRMTLFYEDDLTDLQALSIHASDAEW